MTRPFCRYQNVWLHDLDIWPTFEKNLTLVITFEKKEIGLSYFICVFLVARPFCWYQNFRLPDLDFDFWPTFEKTFITFEPKEVGLSYFTCVFLMARPFCWKQFLALLVEASRAYAIPCCLSVRLSVRPSVRLSVRKQFLLSHLLWGYLSQRLLYSPSLLALWCSCAPAIVIMILSPGAQKGGVVIFPI